MDNAAIRDEATQDLFDNLAEQATPNAGADIDPNYRPLTPVELTASISESFDLTNAAEPANGPADFALGENQFPSEQDRPRYCVYDDWCGPDGKHPPGVYYHYMTKGTKSDPPAPVDTRLCGPLRVVAVARNKQGREFGQVLEFIDKDRRQKRWNMPSRLLAGRGDELQKELFDSGLEIVHNQRGRIAEFISNQHPTSRVWAVSSCGWFDGAFVLPNKVIGEGSDKVMFQAESMATAIAGAYLQSGDLNGWRDSVARYCEGNPLLLLAVSQAFSGALLDKCNVQGVGVHIFGESSKGKTSGMTLAGSVWGPPKLFNKTWTATANGLESAATAANDGLLCLDEMSKADADEVSKSLYMLANGVGKQRATAQGTAKALNTWRVSVLSNGEESIEAHLIKAGIVAKPGELVRFLQLPICGQYGAFNELHGAEHGRAFSSMLTKNANHHHGTAGPAFLEKLTRDDRDFSSSLDELVAAIELHRGQLSPQEGRAARAFALIGMAGELATEYGVTGWQERSAFEAALHCFDQWREHRGKGELEPKQLVAAVRQYVELYGDARFTSTTDDTRLHGERSGYWREHDGGKQWLFSSAGFKKAIGNTDVKQAIKLLTATGALIQGSQKTVTQVKHKGGQGWFYVIQLDHGDHA